MTNEQQNVLVVDEILSKELPLENPLYKNYPAMKLGRRKEVEFYSDYLVKFAEKLLSQDDGNNEWVISAPSYHHLPAGANLMARRVHQLLVNKGFSIELVEMRLNKHPTVIRNQKEFDNYNEYSKNSVDARVKERQRVDELLDESIAGRFKDKSVIIINDINVTGTQQKFIEGNLQDWQAKSWYWFYIFTVEKNLAAKHPEVEYQLNHSHINNLKSYVEVLSDPETECTARCIGRLLDKDMDNFRSLVDSLSNSVRDKVYRLAKSEGRYEGKFFLEKMQLLAGKELVGS